MRHFTLDVVLKQVHDLQVTGVLKVRKPAPFPGRQTPTRVAWEIEVATKWYFKKYLDAHGHWAQRIAIDDLESLRYIGKPNRLRAIEALRFMQKPKTMVMSATIVEFDRLGPVSFQLRSKDLGPFHQTQSAYLAYHPQASPGILEAFTRKWHVKRIGRMSVYSLQKTLSNEKIDAFYAWYEQTFGSKLKRPRGKPMEIHTGVPIDLEGDQ